MGEVAVATERARLEELYRQYGSLIARWAARLGGPRVDIDDLVQEVFVVIADKLSEFRGDAKITTWLFRITENVVRNRRRRERHWRWLTMSGGAAAGSSVTAAPDPAVSLERSESKARIYRALEGLSEVHRNTLILFEMEGLSGEEIAELSGVRLDAVWMRLTRARRQFIRRYLRLERQS